MIGSFVACALFLLSAAFMLGLERRPAVRRFSVMTMCLLAATAAHEALELALGPAPWWMDESIGWLRLGAALAMCAAVLAHFELIFNHEGDGNA